MADRKQAEACGTDGVTLLDLVTSVIRSIPGCDKSLIARRLSQEGFPLIDRREVNRLLYAHPERFRRVVEGDSRPRWYLAVDDRRMVDAMGTLDLRSDGPWGD